MSEGPAPTRRAIGAGTPAPIDCVTDPSDGTESNIGDFNPKGLTAKRPAAR